MESSIALIGFGEAGSTFAKAAGWRASAFVYDPLPARRAVMEDAAVNACATVEQALATAPLILSLVTADAALTVAREYAAFLQSGAIWCDMNSVAPETKRQAACAIEDAGGRYVDVAILAPVIPARLAVPLLLSGQAAGEAEGLLRAVGFSNVRRVGDKIGRASAIKMVRSVMVKGIEALTAEMMLAAAQAGVVDEVLSSLDASEKRDDWPTRAAYNIERMSRHGLRRAAEMEEVCRTLSDLGVEPLMSQGTVQRQRELASRDIPFQKKTEPQ